MTSVATCGVRRIARMLFLGGAACMTSDAQAQMSASPVPAASRPAADAWALVAADGTSSDVAAASAPPEFTWKRSKLGRGSEPAIAVTSGGQPHLVFLAPPSGGKGSGVLRHRWFDGKKWRSENVFVPPGKSLFIGQFVAVAIDGDDVLHVAFTMRDNSLNTGALYYARGDATGWESEPVEPDTYGSVSIATDEAGAPHILHLAGSQTNDVRYLTRGLTGWEGESIGATPYTTQGSSLRVQDSRVYASFTDNASNLRVGIRDEKGWTVDAIASGVEGSLAVDGAGTLHVAYSEWGGVHHNDLVHATLTESGWTYETLIDETSLFGDATQSDLTFLGQSPALAVDASGKVRLAFGLNVYKGQKFGTALAVAFLEDGAWLPFVAGKSLTGFQNAIAIDAAGIVHVATARISFGDNGTPTLYEYSLRGAKLSLVVTPKGGGTIGVAPHGIETAGKSSVNVYPGNTVSLTATAAPGFEFSGWSNAASGTDPTVQVTMNDSGKVIAHFVPTAP